MTAADLCQRTWHSDRPTKSDDSYRQHRCGLPVAEHRYGDDCVCRYCERPRVAELAGDRGGIVVRDIGGLAILIACITALVLAVGWP